VDAQKVGHHIADHDSVGINVAILFEEGVEVLELLEGLWDDEESTVVPRIRFIRSGGRRGMHGRTYGSRVGNANHKVPPRNSVLTAKMAAILRVALKMILEVEVAEGTEGERGKVAP